ncbi:DNA recombination protein RmuC [candidate division KSB1 bacterium]|nr:DNA recombination protein RmuC [candidate division KSB1 bacterium]
MNLLYAGIAVLIVLLFGGLWLLVRRQDKQWKEFLERQRDDPTFKVITDWLKDMREGLDRSSDSLQKRLDATNKAISDRLDSAARVIGAVSKELGQVQEIGRAMKDFQDFLRSPKLRGNIGEQILRDLLTQVLPKENYHIQHRFKAGETVDAVISTDKGLIPVDAKFPMENFRRILQAESEEQKNSLVREFTRDVKKHIDDISKKYILPQEGTVDFAIMYIPAEAVYYEIVMGDGALNTYAYDKKVLLVSPNSFYYFLKVILIGLEGKKIEQATRYILETLSAIRQDSVKFGENLRVLTTHLTNAKNTLDRVNTDFSRLSSRIEDTRLLKAGAAGDIEGGKQESLLGVGEDSK